MKLESLYIDAFRGATRPFELFFNKGSKKRITIIYGANGSGKTTIVDAVDVLGNDGNNSLKDKSLGNVGLAPLVAIGRQRKDSVIRLKTDKGQWTATLGGKSIAVSPAGGCPRIRVLRRRDLSGLLDEAGTSRYERLRKFIDTQPIEDCEANLREASNRAKRDFEQSTTQFNQSEMDLRQEWEALGKPEDDFKQWLRSILDAKDTAEKQQWRDLFGTLSARAGSLMSLRASANTVEQNVGTARAALQSAETTEKQARLAVGDEALADLRAILTETSDYLARHPDTSSCPVCAQPVTSAGLGKRIQEILNGLKQLDAASRGLKEARQKLNAAEAVSKAETEKLAAGVHAFASAFQPDLRSIFPGIGADLRRKLDECALNIFPPESARELAIAIEPHLAELQQKAADQRETIQKQLTQRESVSRRVKEAGRLKKGARTLEELAKRLAKSQKIVEEERKAYVEGILTAIAGEASRIYDAIHPGEGPGDVKLKLNPARRGSLECTAAVPGMKEDENPAAYYSEAHLDTLGFAVFMAEALRESPQDTILVLDDVVSSVDEEHLQRMVTVLELRPNPAGGGLAIGSLRRPERERLRELIAAPDPDLQSIAAKAGVLLEQLLYFLTHTYACPLPCGQHDKGWDLGQYFSGIKKELRKALKSRRFDGGAPDGTETDVGAKVGELQELCALRNVLGCHYNKLAEHLPDADALGFGAGVMALADALVDADGELPTKAVAGQYWMTTSGTLRLYPFSLRDL
jgi:energy-coupling factor transporter ATP-binding protein EcfA2